MKSKTILVSLVLFAIVALFFVWLFFSSNKKMAFVRVDKVFNEFAMSKELKQDLEKTLLARQNVLDSLQAVWRAVEIGNNPKIKEYVEREFYQKRQLFQEQNEALTNKYDKQIWERLNQYTKAYGAENNIDFLFTMGAETGLLYGKNSYDVSDELIQYMNQKYAGK
jgi:Skp family chaperone for outer membrane proteins